MTTPHQDELLTQLMQRLNEPPPGTPSSTGITPATQPLAFLSPEAKTALGNRFGSCRRNIPRLAVTASG